MKKTILSITLILIISSVFSQNVSKGYNFLEKNNYIKAVKVFDKCIKNKKNTLEARYGLAMAYSKTGYHNFNVIKSYNYIKGANIQYQRTNDTEKKRLEADFGITQESIDELKNKVVDIQLNKTKSLNTEQGYNLFLDIYEGTEQAKGIEIYRDSMIFESVKRDNTFESYRAFEHEYPTSFYAPQAKEKYETLWKELYENAYNECDATSIRRFKNKYPDYPFYDQKSSDISKLAYRATKLNLTEGYVANNHDYYIQFIKDAAPYEPAFVCLQRLIAPDLDEKDWQSAVDTLEKYQKYFPDEPRIEGLITILNKKSDKIISQSVSKNINTKFYEYIPVLTTDDKFMYFCGQMRGDNIGGEDIFVSEKVNGEWTKAKLVESLCTAYASEAPLSISADGNTMLLFYHSDIYFSKKTKSGWQEKQIFPTVNSEEDWEADAFLTSDGNAILFISDRPGAEGNYHQFNEEFHGSASGNSDIYVSEKNENGTWSEPINIGSTINTPFSERTPFLHPDMKTMYFSSEGHNSLGFLDVFKTTRLNDSSWTEWSEPINMGKEINTPNKDWGYKISTSGEIAYYSYFSDNQSDINSITIPKELQPEKVATISGIVSDKEKNLLEANIVWENLTTGEKVGSLQSDPISGYYIITLPMGKNYGFYVEKDGYYPLSGNIDLSKNIENLYITKNFELISIKSIINQEASIPLENVFFESGKYNLKPESYPELNRLVGFLKSNNTLKVEISGHTDNKGDVNSNKTLSENRAKAVLDYLVSKGCDKNMLIAKGYGDSKPISENTTEQGRAKNRRVEFQVVK